MVMTILEARVSQENWSALEYAYRQAQDDRDAGLVQSFLIHSLQDPDLWRILTIWESREALSAMRGSTETPRGVLIFRQAGADPSLSIFDIPQNIPPLSQGTQHIP